MALRYGCLVGVLMLSTAPAVLGGESPDLDTFIGEHAPERDHHATVEAYERYLRGFKDRAPADARLVAHARLGALYLRASCPLASWHGGCVETWREPRICPRHDEGNYRAGPVFPATHGDGATYLATVAKVHSRDKRLVARATFHLRAALSPRDVVLAEQAALPDPARRRALANAWAEATVNLATLDLDRYLGMGAVPEALDFSTPTPFDSPCDAHRKQKAFAYSQTTFFRWMREKSAGYTSLLAVHRKAIARGGPEGVVLATARFAAIQQELGDALAAADTEYRDCPHEGFDHPDTLPFHDYARDSAKACLRLANAHGITSPAAGYCRLLANQGRTADGDAIPEIVSTSSFLDPVHDESAPAPVIPATMAIPPKAKPKPPRTACMNNRTRSGLRGGLGVLEMSDGRDLTPVFARALPFPDTFPAELAQRFPPWAPPSPSR